MPSRISFGTGQITHFDPSQAPKGYHTAYGVASGQGDAAMIKNARWDVWQVKFGKIDKFAAAGRACSCVNRFRDAGVALPAELVHLGKITPGTRMSYALGGSL